MNIKIKFVFFALILFGFGQSIFTQLPEGAPSATTNVVIIEKEDKKGSHFFRNLMICCAFFVAGYITADSQNGIYILCDGQKYKEIDFLEAYLYKLGIKQLHTNEEIAKVFNNGKFEFALNQMKKAFFNN